MRQEINEECDRLAPYRKCIRGNTTAMLNIVDSATTEVGLPAQYKEFLQAKSGRQAMALLRRWPDARTWTAWSSA